jgi:hypothetical protein
MNSRGIDVSKDLNWIKVASSALVLNLRVLHNRTAGSIVYLQYSVFY